MIAIGAAHECTSTSIRCECVCTQQRMRSIAISFSEMHSVSAVVLFVFFTLGASLRVCVLLCARKGGSDEKYRLNSHHRMQSIRLVIIVVDNLLLFFIVLTINFSLDWIFALPDRFATCYLCTCLHFLIRFRFFLSR